MTILRSAALAALAVCALGAPAAAHDRHAHGHAHASHAGAPIVISCYRGPFRNRVIVDQANSVFVDSLAGYGISFAEARAIATSVCRNPAYLDDLAGARPFVTEALRRAIAGHH